MTAGSTRLPLTVVGGYLGAGKTTLVNRLLADPRGQRIAVLVNDFGEIGIDEVLIGEASDDPSILSLANGCVCCSLAEGFAETLGKVREMAHRLDRVVVEVSGVGEPAKVARWSRTPGFSPDGVVVVVDGSRIGEQLEDRRIGETVAAQVADADLLLLTRADLLDDEALAAAEAVLQPATPPMPNTSPAHESSGSRSTGTRSTCGSRSDRVASCAPRGFSGWTGHPTCAASSRWPATTPRSRPRAPGAATNPAVRPGPAPSWPSPCPAPPVRRS